MLFICYIHNIYISIIKSSPFCTKVQINVQKYEIITIKKLQNKIKENNKKYIGSEKY
jgi:hypothetical protein